MQRIKLNLRFCRERGLLVESSRVNTISRQADKGEEEKNKSLRQEVKEPKENTLV